MRKSGREGVRKRRARAMWIPVLLGSALATGVLQAQEEAARLVEIRSWSLGGVTRVAVETTGEIRYRSDRLSNPDRIYFDLLNTRIEGSRSARAPVRVIGVGDGLVHRIRYAPQQPGVTRVVLDLAAPADYVSSQLTNPDRLMIEVRALSQESASLPPAEAERPPPAAAKEAGGTGPRAEAVRAGPSPTAPAPRPTPGDTQAAVKPPVRRFVPPADPAPREVPLTLIAFAIPPHAPSPSIRQLRLPRELDQTAIRPSPPARPAEVKQAASVPAPAPPASSGTGQASAGPAPTAAPAKAGRYGGRSLTRVLGLKLGRVVLDPGHGGHDTGTVGRSGMMEKDLVLDIAQRLAGLVRERMGSEVILTREDDRFVPLERRTEIANEEKADLFLSIHANSSPIRTVVGMETYYLNFTTSRDALDVAARENAGAQKSIHELSDLIRKIALKDKVEESREFAARVQLRGHELVRKTYGKTARDRGVKKAPFVVLIGAEMPSVLTEIGFMSNAREEALMKKPEHRQKIAEALLAGIEGYAATLSHFRVARRQDDE